MDDKSTYVTNGSGDIIADLWARIAQAQEENRELERKQKRNDRIIDAAYREIIEKKSVGLMRSGDQPSIPHVPYAKEKFGSLECDVDYLYALLTNDYKVILPMDILDFKLAFSGLSDPKAAIVCKNTSLFINILFWIQAKGWLPSGKLNGAVYDQCRNRKEKFIDKHNIESEFSKSRNQQIHLKAEEIIKKLKQN